MSINITTIFEEFEKNIHELEFYADIVQESYKKYLSEIEDHKKKHLDIEFYSSKRPVYFDILNKHEKIISDLRVDKSLEQTSDDIFFHYNKQMQWFLVETYEMYEKFIDKLYIIMGYMNNNFWDASDFGEIQLNNISNKDEKWFSQQIKKKKEKPYSIIKIFRKRFNIEQYFDKQIPDTNYAFLMNLISKFRNAIVHDKGFLEKTVLKDKLFKQEGVNGKEIVKKYEKYINVFYGKDEYDNLICLTSITSYIKDIKALPINYNRKSILIQHILSYAYLLTQLSIQYLLSYKTKFCKVNYLEKQNAVLCEWQQLCKGNDYREHLEFGLELLLKTGATTWITDTTNGFENESEDTQWLIGEFLPKVLQTNCKKIVFIMEQDSPLKEEIDAQAVALGEYFEVLQVKSLEELEKVQDE